MEKSFVFNSINKDRVYKAEDFASYFASFIGNGIFPNPSSKLQVIDNNDMTIKVKEGKAWINGYYYQNTSDFILKLESADSVLNRIDRVVLRLDLNKRAINLNIKKGEFSSNEIAKSLQRDADAYEIALADIKVSKGAISIKQTDITDLRLNKSMCGIVHGTVDQVDTTAIFNQFQSWYSQTKNAYDEDIVKWTKEKKEVFNQWYAENTKLFLDTWNKWYGDNTAKWEENFNNWFTTIKGQLDGDIAANLANRTIELEKKITTVESQMSEMATKTEVQTAQSKADSAYTLANSKQDKLAISSSVTSTSTTEVANSYAVKQAMDKAKEAFTLGDSTKKDVVGILSSKGLEGLTTSSDWRQIKNTLQNMSLGKKWAEGEIPISNATLYKIENLNFTPKNIFMYTKFLVWEDKGCNTYYEAWLAQSNTINYKLGKVQGYSPGDINVMSTSVYLNTVSFGFASDEKARPHDGSTGKINYFITE